MIRINLKSAVSGIVLALAAAPAAFADHNSPWGEGWATDAMGVHSARFDSLNDDSVTGNAFLEASLLDVGAASMGAPVDAGVGAGVDLGGMSDLVPMTGLGGMGGRVR